MGRHKWSESRRAQRSIWYAADALSADEHRRLRVPDLGSEFYTSMLIDDVSLWVAPPSMHATGKVRAVLDPPNPNGEKLVALALGRDRDAYQADLSDAMYNFMHDCAQTIVGYGFAPYEIVYLSPVDSDRFNGFELFSIFPPALLEQDGKPVQYVPRSYAETGQFPPLIELDPTRLAFFSLPAPLTDAVGGAVASLFEISRSRGMELAIDAMRAGRKVLPYDFRHHKRSEHTAVAEATKEVGWDARGLFREEQTEYHVIYRQLAFMRFVAQVREAVLDGVNRVMEEVGRVLTPLGHVKLEGLPSSSDAEAALRELAAGSRSFKDLVAPFIAS